jgi:hypoxanthine phosphoribosyltransferase
MKKIYNSWKDTEKYTQEILRQITIDGWRPDYVVGLTRGGLVPANLISQYLGCRMETLKVSFRNSDECESNLWMAEDAFEGKNILIVDDINDSGATLNWIKNDWPSGCLPSDSKWNDIWGTNVRVAVLYDNEASESTMPISYSAVDINKVNDPCWIVFPWEEWWR